jgi:hypothetical protein
MGLPQISKFMVAFFWQAGCQTDQLVAPVATTPLARPVAHIAVGDGQRQSQLPEARK